MNNFTKSSGKAFWHSTTNLTCCGIDLSKLKSKGMKNVMFFLLIMLSFSFSVNAQTEFLPICQDEAPGPPFTEEEVADLYSNQCPDGVIEVTLVTTDTGDDCEWTRVHRYDVKCDDATLTPLKVIYNGGDESAPEMVGDPPSDLTDVDACFADIPAGPTEEEIAALYEDNCGNVNVTKSGVPSGDDCNWSVLYKYTIVDDCGNQADDLDITYSGGDMTPPELNKGEQLPTGSSGLNLCFENVPEGPSEADIAALFSDECGGEITVIKDSYFKGDDCGWKGEISYTVIDACGNALDPIILAYSGSDTEDPVLDYLPEDFSVTCIDLVPAADSINYTDNCKDDGKLKADSVDDTSGLGNFCEGGIIIRTWTATDNCGNSTSHSITITVEPAPQAEFDTPQDYAIDCSEVEGFEPQFLGYSNGGEGACDISGQVQGTAEPFEGSCGSFVVNYEYTDECGRTSTASQTVTVIDNKPPVLTPAENYTAECDGAGNQAELDAWLADNGGATAVDDCGNVTWSNNFSGLSDECGATGSATVEFTATDDCGNSDKTTATFTIVDTTNPTIDTPAEDETVECDGAGNQAALDAWLTNNGGATASDICGDVTWSNNFIGLSDDCGATGSATVEFTATDDCGNESTTSATFTIVDTTDPVITPTVNEVVECDGEGNLDAFNAWLANYGGATASDVCGGTVIYAGQPSFAEACGNTGTYTVEFTAYDDCENEAKTTGTFTIVDTNSPPITEEAADLSVECDGLGNQAEFQAWLDANGGAQAYDLCSDITWTNDNDGQFSDDCGLTGSIYVLFTVTDECGLSSSTGATFSIIDTSNPSIDIAAMDMTVECDGAGNQAELDAWLANNGGAEASDTCGDVSWSNDFTGLSDDCGETGQALVVFTATDDCGNASKTSATFYIIDTTDPEITPAADETVECDGAGNQAELDAWLANNGGATAEDDCGNVTWSNNFTGLSDECGATGSATVEFTATDDCGNESKTSATFTIEDTTNPTIDVPAKDEVVECDGEGNQAQLAAWLASNGGASASDLCGDVTWSNNFNGLSDDCGATGSATVEFTATDDCGNESKTTATFTIEDTTNPEITDAQDMTVECGPDFDACNYTIVLGDTFGDGWNGGAITVSVNGIPVLEGITLDVGSLSDPIPFPVNNGDIISTSYDSVGAFPGELFTEIYDADANLAASEEDGAGTAYLKAACPSDGDANSLLDAWLANNGGATADDLCGDVTWSNNFTGLSDDCGNTGSAEVEFTATDSCGNSSKTSAIFTIVDTTDPSISVPAMDQTVECSPAVGSPCDYTIELGDTFGDGWNGAALTLSVNGNPVLIGITLDSGSLGAQIPFTVNNGDVVSTSYDSFGAFQNELFYTIYNGAGAPVNFQEDGNTTVGLAANCDGSDGEFAAWLANNGGAQASDLCGDITWSNDSTGLSDDCGNTGTETVTFTATDECGNTSSTTATFTVIDTTDPTIDVEADDLTVECDGAGNQAQLDAWLASNGGAEASDTCGGVTWSNDFVGLSDDCGATGSATVIFTATDDCGNTSETSATFTIEDTTNPTIDVDAKDLIVECDGAGNQAELDAWLANNAEALASDICSGVTWSNDFQGLSDDCGATGSALVTFRATDDCGNWSETSATFTIQDTTDPTIDVAAADLTVECDGNGNQAELAAWLANNGGAQASDECGSVTWSHNCYNPWIGFMNVFDGNGGFIFGSGWGVPDLVTLVDENTNTLTLKPNRIGDPDPFWITEGEVFGNNIMDASTYVQNDTFLGQAISFNGNVTSNTLDPEYSYFAFIRIFTADYSSVTELQAPLDGGPFSIETDGSIAPAGGHVQYGFNVRGRSVNPDAAFDAAYDALGSIVVEAAECILQDDCGATGSVTVDFTATDECGNTSVTTATFTIEDTTDPVITTPPADLTVECDGAGNQAELDAWLADYAGAAGNDQCGDVTWSHNFSGLSDDCGETGSAIVEFTLTDECGNDVKDTATFTIVDTTDPTIDTPAADLTVECDGAGNQAELDAWLASNGGAAASDICSGVTWSNNFLGLSDECGATGSATVEFTATDECGNEAKTTATFTIEDTVGPEFIGPDPQNLNGINACYDDRPAPPSLEEIAALFYEACGEVVVELWSSPTGDDCSWSELHVYTITDECGNPAADEIKIFYAGGDNTKPTIDGVPPNVTVECDAIPDPAEPTASDNCAGPLEPSYNEVRTDGDCPYNYTLTRTWTATDECGNSTSESQVITVQDTTAPTLKPDAELPPTETWGINSCQPEGDYGPSEAEIAALYEDNCGDVVVTKDIKGNTGDDCKWIINIEYIVEDECGNVADIFKLWYHGGDETPPAPTGLCANEEMNIYTSQGGSCPDDAWTSLIEGQIVSPSEDWTVAGVPLSQMGPNGASLMPCFEDDCTDQKDLRYEVMSIVYSGGCPNVVTITFDVLDTCDNRYEGFVCLFNVIDDELPVLDCPEGEDLGHNPPADPQTGTPYGLVDKVPYSDNCDGDGITFDYSDELLLAIADGISSEESFTILCDINGPYSEWNFVKSGYDLDGYATYSGDIPDFPSYTTYIDYNSVEGRFQVHQVNLNTNEDDVVFVNYTADYYPSCDSNAWTAIVGPCQLEVLCDGFSYNYWTLNRTFSYTDACGNTGECVVTYTWTEDGAAPLAAPGQENVTCYGNQTIGTPSSLFDAAKGLEDSVELDFTAYPVPFDKEVNIKYNFEFDTDVTIEVYDTKGLLVLSETHNNSTRNLDHSTKLDLSRGGDQIFYVTVTTNRGSVTKKVVSSGIKRR
ncbi:MAG: T9SS type A sorting domain-containing protein [Flavobacteriaceae bacterium]|nr:T9SS type A sorting domain-containing protein [Flavobacteriaceae bacterium]